MTKHFKNQLQAFNYHLNDDSKNQRLHYSLKL